MTRLNIDLGIEGNPATGDTLRTAMSKINDNFQELYLSNAADGNLTTSVTNGNVSIQPNGTGNVEIDALSVNSDNITSLTTNSSVTITGNGTAGVDIEALSFNGTSISSADSSRINLNENVTIDGDLVVTGSIAGTFTVSSLDADSSTVSNLEVDNFKASAIVIESEGIGSNDNDTTIPTSAAVKDYVDNNAGGTTGDLAITGSSITSPSNADLTLSAGGTGSVDIEGIQIKGTEISSADSTQVTIKENLHVTGTITGSIDADNSTISNLEVDNFKASAIITEGEGIGSNDNDTTLPTSAAVKDYVDARDIGDLSVTGSTISAPSNADLTLTTSGTGSVSIDGIQISGTEISSSDSTQITIKENLHVTGNISGTITGTVSTLDADNTTVSNLEVDNFKAATIVIESEGIGSNDNDTTIPTSAAVKDYVDNNAGGTTGDLAITGSTISAPSNADLTLNAGGTGSVDIEGIQIKGTEISSSDSTQVTIKENLHVTGNITGTINANQLSGALPAISGSNLTGVAKHAFRTIQIGGGNTLVADDAVDTLTINPGNNVTITDDQASDAFTINVNGMGDLTFVGSTIISPSNADITLSPGGTGSVSVDGIQIKGTELSSSDSTQITIKENLHVTGNISGTITGTVTGTIDADNSTISNLEVDNFKASAIVTEGEGIGSNDNDTTIPTSAAVKDYVDSNPTTSLAADNLTIGDAAVTITTTTGDITLDTQGNNRDIIFKGTDDGVDITPLQIDMSEGGKAIFQADIQGQGVTISDNKITSNRSNDNLELQANGTGSLVAQSPFVAQSPITFNAGYIEKINTLTSSSTITVDCSAASIHKVTLATNTGFVITNLPTGGTVTLIITQDGSGSRTATFGTDGSSAVKFPGGAPTLSTGAGDIDVVTIINDGTNFLGNCAKDYS